MSDPRYARDTKVSPDETLAQIRKELRKYGATDFGYIDMEDAVVVAFQMRDRRIRFTLPIPDRDSMAVTNTRGGRWGSAGQVRPIAEGKYQRYIASKWRSLLLSIKAKLESVDSGIETFEEAFLAHVVMTNNQTVQEWLGPQLEQMFEDGEIPPLLSDGRKR